MATEKEIFEAQLAAFATGKTGMWHPWNVKEEDYRPYLPKEEPKKIEETKAQKEAKQQTEVKERMCAGCKRRLVPGEGWIHCKCHRWFCPRCPAEASTFAHRNVEVTESGVVLYKTCDFCEYWADDNPKQVVDSDSYDSDTDDWNTAS